MKHSSEATLALYAGRDLGWFARWRTERHLARCPQCFQDAEDFLDLRREVTVLGDLHGIPWNRLAGDMKANIRLGLAAGECVRDTPPERKWVFTDARSIVAYALATLLIVAGVWIEHPAPPPAASNQPEDTVVRVAGNGIELKEGAQAIRLLHDRNDNDGVTYSAGAQGAMRARYVDSKTGYVTINSVYVQ